MDLLAVFLVAFLMGAVFGLKAEQSSVIKSINEFGKFRINNQIFEAEKIESKT